ncbi:orf95 [Trichoplusia ni single nucleopolyhedrovirus]|uniref:Orf95 n=1 Tax=Trichoplusia ni single nucleopolyhedrovirus TaxID=332054 RepID=Q461X1_9ABAC|nr:orf95 [Trichoplusia ni single nucleopolyhedrovirus]AAZ67465.1 orf95 [Trichoplusia ni single nucleopolyhedrovirus]
MRRMARTIGGDSNTNSILNQDQLEQLVGRNQSFLRDFLLVICGVVVFIVCLLFIMLIFNMSSAIETRERQILQREQTFMANLDYRYRQPERQNQ